MTLAQAYQAALSSLARGDQAMAETLCERILAVEPSAPQALHLMGGIQHAAGRGERAVDFIRRAIAARPDAEEYHNSLGVVLSARGCFEEACAALRGALRLRPAYPEAHYNLGLALAASGRYEEAAAEYRFVLQQMPGFARCHAELGAVLATLGEIEAAEAACQRAAGLDAHSGEILINLGNVLLQAGKSEEAIAAYRRALIARPDDAICHNNLANGLKDLGLLDDAITLRRQAIALRPDEPLLHSNLVYELQFHPKGTAELLREEAARWNRQHAERFAATRMPHGNSPDPERRLKVGYVSPNFASHVISHFLVPLLEAHDRSRFEIHCYSSVARPDRITGRIRQAAAVWRDVRQMGDEALAAQIRDDGVDILVDLTQHLADNRLLVFARKPAPVQVAWLGYPGTTGLAAIDYRLTDSIMEPDGAPWSHSVEQPVRLPDCWFCFDPLDAYPEPGELPALAAGAVTFGSLNNFCKLNEAVLTLWAEVLRAVPGSRLLLQCPAGERAEWLRQFLERQGIERGRVQLVPRTATRAEFLALFVRIDIALDPFPYNGGTTTCEALWMGLPVLTLPRLQTVSRIGLSIVSAIGLPELAADSEADFVRRAVRLAGDLPSLAALRSTLRSRMKTSRFMDAPRFARNVEDAYRTMWRAWCATRQVVPVA